MKRVQNLYFEDGVGLTTVLSTVLFLTVAAALVTADGVTTMQMLIPVTLGALAVSLLTATSRFDSFFAFSHGMLTGLAWILYLMAGTVTPAEREPFLLHGFSTLQANVYTVLLRLLQWTQVIAAPQTTTDPYVRMFGLSFLLWWLTYLGIWSIFRHGYTWRAVIPAGLVLLIQSVYAQQSLVPYLVVFAFVALLLLARTNLAEQQLRWRFQHAYVSKTIAPDVMRTGMSYVMLVLCSAWLLPGLGRSAVIRDVLPDPSAIWTTLHNEVEELLGLPTPRNSASTARFTEALSLGGERTADDQIIFTVYANEARYWRAVVFDTYNGRGWENTTELQMDFAAQSALPVADWQLREPLTQTIVLHESTGNVIIGAPDILWIDQPIRAKVEPLTAVPLRMVPTAGSTQSLSVVPVDFTMVHTDDILPPGTIYSVISRRSVATAEALRGANSAYPVAITARYLQLPPNFSPRVATLARDIVATAPADVYARAKAIETYLRQIPYNDMIPAPPAAVDPLEYFLFSLREGYCDYYATAMATMLRSLGIPARIASGYAEGTHEPGSNQYIIHARDAHTWVEVYFPRYGWIEFEPTAGESELQRASDEGSLPPMAPTPTSLSPLEPLTSTITPTAAVTAVPTPPFPTADAIPPAGGGAPVTQPWWLWALLTPPLVLLAVWSVRRTPAFAPTTFTVEQPQILYERLLHWTQRLGIHLPPTDTPYEQARRLGRHLPEGRSFIQQIIQAYVLYRFRDPSVVDKSNDGTHQALLQRNWQKLEALLRKVWLRRVYRGMIRRGG